MIFLQILSCIYKYCLFLGVSHAVDKNASMWISMWISMSSQWESIVTVPYSMPAASLLRSLSSCIVPILLHHCWDLYPVVLSQYSWPCLSENQGPRVDFILRPLCELRPRDTGLGSHRVPIVHFFNIVQTAFDPTPHPPWTMFKKMCYCYKMASLKCLLRKAPCQMFRYFSLFFSNVSSTSVVQLLSTVYFHLIASASFMGREIVWLHLFDFFHCMFSNDSSNWCHEKKTKSHWLHLFDFSPLCIFKCWLKDLGS